MAVEAEAASGQPDAGNTGQADSLSDAISAALAASEKEAAPAEAQAEEKAAPGVDEAKAGEGRTGEDARAPEAAQDGKDAGEAVQKDDAPAFEAPAHWSEAHRKAFAELDAKAKQVVVDLAKASQAHLTRRSQELGDKARYADHLRSAIDDNTRGELQAAGLTEAQYINYLHQVQQYAKRDALGYVKWTMQTLGVTPDQLGFPATSEPDQTQQQADDQFAALLTDPKVKVLEAKLAQLEGKLTEREQQELRASQMRRLQHERQMERVAHEFRSALDDATGTLRYPHFDAVMPHMGALMLGDPDLAQMPDGPEKLAAAYDRAVWARPDLRQSLVEAEAARRVAAAEKAREAQRAKSVTAVKPAAGVVAQTAKPVNLDDIIADAMRSRLG